MKNEMTRYHFVEALVKEVYAGGVVLLGKTTKEFVQRNNSLLSVNAQGFLFNNILYGSLVPGEKTPRLATSLEEDFLRILSMHCPTMDEDAGRVKHFFVSILNNTISKPELEALFPSPLHQIITQYQDLLIHERTRPDSWIKDRLASTEQVRELILQKLCLNLLIVS